MIPIPQAPEWILHSGRVHADEAPGRTTEAIAIGGKRILAIGSDRDLLSLAGPGTRKHDLGGRRVIPGLIDSHNHLSIVGQGSLGCDISGIASIDDLLEAIRAAALTTEPGAWIMTTQVGESVISHELREGRYPYRRELDRAAPNHPVCVRSFHVGILNTKALERLGITRSTPSPKGGEIGRQSQPDGELDGRFYEAAWTTLVERRLPEPSLERRVSAIESAARKLNRLGITQVCEHGIPWKTWEAYGAAQRANRLSVKVSAHLHVGPGSQVEDDGEAIREVGRIRQASSPGDRVRLDGVKVFIDGGVALGTAYFARPYRTAYGEWTNGLQVTPAERLRSIVRLCLENRIQISQHASGDAAIAHVLDAYDAVADSAAIRNGRFILVHCQFPVERDIDRIADRGVLVAAQTLFLYNMGQGYTQYHGERGKSAVPLRTFLDRGCHVGLGSDAPVNQFHPFMGAWHAMNRVCKATGERMDAGQVITESEAFRCYTERNAWFGSREASTGRLVAGAAADLAILESDPDLSSLESALATRVACTIIDGEVVHGSLPATD